MAFWNVNIERERELEQALWCVEAVDMSLSETIALINSADDSWIEKNVDMLLNSIKIQAQADQELLRMAAKRIKG